MTLANLFKRPFFPYIWMAHKSFRGLGVKSRNAESDFKRFMPWIAGILCDTRGLKKMENLSPAIFLAIELRSFHHILNFVWFCLFHCQSGIKNQGWIKATIELPEEGQFDGDILFEHQSTMFESYLYIPLNLFFASTCTMGRTQRWIIFN